MKKKKIKLIKLKSKYFLKCTGFYPVLHATAVIQRCQKFISSRRRNEKVKSVEAKPDRGSSGALEHLKK